VTIDFVHQIVHGFWPGRISPTVESAIDLLLLSVRFNAVSVRTAVEDFIADASHSPQLLLRSIEVLLSKCAPTARLEAALRSQLRFFIGSRDHISEFVRLPLAVLDRVLRDAIDEIDKIDMNAFLTFFEACLTHHGTSASVLLRTVDLSLLTSEHQLRLFRNVNFDWRFLPPTADSFIRRLACDSVSAAAERAQLSAQSNELLRLRQEKEEMMSTIEFERNLVSRQSESLDSIHRELKEMRSSLAASRDIADRAVTRLIAFEESQIEALRSVKDDLVPVPAASRQIVSRNPWVDRGALGNLANFNRLLGAYPLDQFEWGIAYNTVGPEPIAVCKWNRGYRLLIKTFVPHGDNASGFHIGTAVFTCGTDDAESRDGFYHRYLNSSFAPCCGSHGLCGHRVIYTRYR
jgi:hypothetical protein